MKLNLKEVWITSLQSCAAKIELRKGLRDRSARKQTEKRKELFEL